MGTGIDPKVDFAFKRVFGSADRPDLLCALLNAVLERKGTRRIRSVTIRNPFSLKDALDDRLAILDIRACDESGGEEIIEMQMVKHAAFRERLLYYLAKDYSQMLNEGDDFTKLQPVTVVCFINDILDRETKNFHSHYEMIDPNTKLRFSSHWAIHLIELPKFKKSADELANDLDRWSYFLRHGEELDASNLPADLDAPLIRSALGVLETMSLNQQERMQYEARLNFQRDQSCYLSTAREEGREEGELIGLRKSILRIGQKRLGEPPTELPATLDAITDLDRLNELQDRILDCPAWQDLLAVGGSTP